jgi:hypothetical protein
MKWFKLGWSGKLHGSKSVEGTTFRNAYWKKKGNKNTKSLAYTSLVRPILEYGAAFFGAAYEGSTNVCVLQSLYRRQGVEGDRG